MDDGDTDTGDDTLKDSTAPAATTNNPRRESTLARIKRISSSLLRSSPHSATTTHTPATTGTATDSVSGADDPNAPTATTHASFADKFLGAAPFSLLLTAASASTSAHTPTPSASTASVQVPASPSSPSSVPAGVGIASLIDRVFGVTAADINSSSPFNPRNQPQTPDPSSGTTATPDAHSPAAAAGDPSTPPSSNKKKPLQDIVRVSPFAHPMHVLSLAESPRKLSFLSPDIFWFFVPCSADIIPQPSSLSSTVTSSPLSDIDIAACRAILAENIPLLFVLSKADLLSRESVYAIESAIRQTINDCVSNDPSLRLAVWDVVAVANPPCPVCSDCGSMAILKEIPDTGFSGWFCTNEKCDLYGSTAFRINKSHQSVRKQVLPLIGKTRQLLLSRDPTLTSASINNSNSKPIKSDDSADSKDIPADAPNPTTVAASSHAAASVLANRRFQIAQLVDTSPKFEYAKIFVITSTLLSAGFGANPIPFIDAPLLVATQFTLITSVCSVYGLPNTSTYYGLFKYVLAAPLLGLMGADILKLIPGVGTVVGGVVDVVICATLTLSLGIAVVKICENAIRARNACNAGVAQPRPQFRLDSQVGVVFKEVYSDSKDAVRAMLKTGSLTKDGLLAMMQAAVGGGVPVDDDDDDEGDGAFDARKPAAAGAAGSAVRENIADDEIEGLAYELILEQKRQRDEMQKAAK
ncbi:hypothetical protein HDU84_008306 [Entophlyctis sp. JEL0112]|nr:hypothetical protein HDU84_008306 [Entophlyctis sp. JEL0112]